MRRLLPLAVLIAILAFGAAAIFVIPDHLVHRDLVPDGLERTKLRLQARTTLLQSLLGVLVLVGAYLTWQQVRVSRESQITDRFTKAVDQLANKDKEIDVRIGGIYALGRIAKDSPVDQASIEDILASYIRNRAPWPPKRPGQYVETADLEDMPILERRAPDIYAAIHVLTHSGLPVRFDGDSFYTRRLLYAVDLRNLVLGFANLDGAFLSGSNLSGSLMDGSSFRQAILASCRLNDASFNGVDFRSTRFTGSSLERVDFTRTNLTQANLERANLKGADLTSANVTKADFTGSTANSETKWPSGFDPEKRGVRVEDDPTF
jgi:Pentapeptide repeats (8 copies)